MADLEENNLATMEEGSSSLADDEIGKFLNGPDNSDSDDYEPSTPLAVGTPVPLDPSKQTSAESSNDTVASPNSHAPHPLPPRPLNTYLPTTAQLQSETKSFPGPLSTSRAQPRMMGGFEVDDDLEHEGDTDDNKDVLDIYDPIDGTGVEPAAPTYVHQTPLDSISNSSSHPDGAVRSSIRSNLGFDGTSGIPSPTIPVNAVLPQRASTATPLQVGTNDQTRSVPTPVRVNASPSSALPKARLAHDVVGILEDRLKNDPRGDMAAWRELLSELKSRNKQDELRKTYERFFKVFPMAAEQWSAYVRWEEENDKKYEMEQIFQRSLLSVPSVELWSIYINYIRRRNSMSTGDTTKAYKIIYDSFSFALNNVGMDKDSAKLWQDYIAFIKTGPGVVGGNGWQDTQKMDTLRAAYQKAICVPTSVLNSLWKEYDVFENALSKINGRKFLQERSPAYMTARSAMTQLQNITRDLDRTTFPKLPPALGYAGDAEYRQQVDLWNQWIQWEKDDNLVLKEDEPDVYRNRVLFTYKQALMALQFWPEMWYDAAEFCFSSGLNDEGLKFLNQGISANPEACLLAFKLADRLELTTTSDERVDPGAKLRMKQIREPYDNLLDALYGLISKTRQREAADISRIELATQDSSTGANINETADEYDEQAQSDNTTTKEVIQAQIDQIKQKFEDEIEVLRKTVSYAWVALMRAARRVQGKGLPGERGGGFRLIFADARKRGQITSDVYVESALIEYHCYKDPAGTKIFERGMKLFPTDEVFTLEYLKHLIAINDITNARAVFETIVGRLTASPTTAARAKPLFKYLHEYESHFGELSQITRLEKRIDDLYPEDRGLMQFAERFMSAKFDPVTVRPVISPSQKHDKTQSLDMVNPVNHSPALQQLNSLNTNSPKRPLPFDDFEDNQPRKMLRGESPLKGAAGRRMHEQRQQLNGFPPNVAPQGHVPIPPPLPNQIGFLLSIMPKASTYVDTRFDPQKMVELIRDIRLPPSNSIRPLEQQNAPAPPSWQPPQVGQQHFQPQQLPAGYMAPPGMMQAQYGG